MTEFSLSYRGSEAQDHLLDFYDASKALVGFQRSLALTVHLALNGEIITQAPSLKGARVLVGPPVAGSWEIVATVLGGISAASLAPKDSVLGHFTRSLYDYVLKATLGIDVDFEKTIRQQFAEQCAQKGITEEKLDSLIEKTEPAIVEMHRPIVWSQSARRARVFFGRDGDKLVGPSLTPATYEHATRTKKLTKPEKFDGLISSYNANTFKGRIYLVDAKRPVPFELAEKARDTQSIRKITSSLRSNALDRLTSRRNYNADITMNAFRHESSTGRLKSIFVVEVSPFDLT
ncbi:hypothetical protein [Sphingomonas sp.]|uniref:DUF7946 domain-containing protein n=1 Tax=Sphingomonas sp. TaxID=28214 RepID=UPI0025E86162|nr:hypothetical protein [Sphingomonas sp.]MBV9529437.1 hypothetical protein [Sphingomonas sp.]